MYKFSTKKTGKVIANTMKEVLDILLLADVKDNAIVYDLNEYDVVGNCTFAYFKTQV